MNLFLKRTLDDREFRDDALPLRFRGFHDELGFARGVKAPCEIEDDLDRWSTQLGIYHERELICCWRLIADGDGESLPTAKLLNRAALCRLPRPAVEVSKLVVSKAYRGRGVASLALRASILEARRRSLRGLIISVIDDPRFQAFLERFAFMRIAGGLSFKDDRIEATRPAAAYFLAVPHLTVDEMESRFDGQFERVRAAIEGHASYGPVVHVGRTWHTQPVQGPGQSP